MKVTVDAVIFSYFNDQLHTLLIKRAFEPFKDSMALPGGFVNDNETTQQAVLRKLKEETNIELDYLEQLYTFSDVNRDPRERIISVTYYGLINPSKYNLVKNIHAKEVLWVPTNEVMSILLSFDHSEIHYYALKRLRNKIRYEPIGFELLSQYFSMTELYQLYCSILGYELDRRNFTKKINKYKLLNKTNFKTKAHVGRKAQLYEFNKEKYSEFKEKGFNFEI